MSIKNIVRNLFVSGALVMSGGVVCSKPVSAGELDDLIKEAMCLANFEKCVLNVLGKGKTGCDGSSCINFSEVNKCLELQKKCFEKAAEAKETVQEHFYDTN